jgi:hypothetical protein
MASLQTIAKKKPGQEFGAASSAAPLQLIVDISRKLPKHDFRDFQHRFPAAE